MGRPVRPRKRSESETWGYFIGLPPTLCLHQPLSKASLALLLKLTHSVALLMATLPLEVETLDLGDQLTQ